MSEKKRRKLEAATLAVGKAMGFEYSGPDILGEAERNPRVANWIAIATAAIGAWEETK